MNNLDKQYLTLLQTILDFGVNKKDRTGTGTKSIFGYTIRHSMKEGFPLLTTKKMAWKQIVTELLWFLRGDTNIKWLLENGNEIWVGDAFKNYINKYKGNWEVDKNGFIEAIKTSDDFSKEYGELGPIYGRQWRSWTNYTGDEIQEGTYEMTNEPIDQIANLICDLKTNPDSRRLMVSAWNVGELDQMVLPPCHYGFQVYTRELSLDERMSLWEKMTDKDVLDFPIGPLSDEQCHDILNEIGVKRRAISLMWNQRSVDTFLGLPFNIASYGLLLEILARSVDMVPDQLIGNLGDVHLYNNHIDQAKKQIDREPFELPNLKINSGNENWDLLTVDEIINSLDVDYTFKLENYQSHPGIKAPLSN